MRKLVSKELFVWTAVQMSGAEGSMFVFGWAVFSFFRKQTNRILLASRSTGTKHITCLHWFLHLLWNLRPRIVIQAVPRTCAGWWYRYSACAGFRTDSLVTSVTGTSDEFWNVPWIGTCYGAGTMISLINDWFCSNFSTRLAGFRRTEGRKLLELPVWLSQDFLNNVKNHSRLPWKEFALDWNYEQRRSCWQ